MAESGRPRGRRANLFPDRCRRSCRSTCPWARHCRSGRNGEPSTAPRRPRRAVFAVLRPGTEPLRRLCGNRSPRDQFRRRAAHEGKVERLASRDLMWRSANRLAVSGDACPDQMTSERHPSIREPSTGSLRRLPTRRTGWRIWALQAFARRDMRGQVEDDAASLTLKRTRHEFSSSRILSTRCNDVVVSRPAHWSWIFDGLLILSYPCPTMRVSRIFDALTNFAGSS